MSCTLTTTTLVEDVDYELDVANGRILFKSTGLLGPDLATLLAGGGCGAQVDFCGSAPLHIPCPSKINECLPCDDDPVLNISAEDEDTDRFLFNFNTRQRPRLGFSFQSVGCKRFCYSEESQLDADLCAILQVTECINDGFRDETGPTIGTVPPFQVPGSPALFFNSAQTCTTFCPDGTSFGATIAAGLVANGNQAQANRIAHSLACRLSALQRICIRTTSLPAACLDTPYSKQLLGSGGSAFHVTFDNIGILSALCSPSILLLNDLFPYVWSATGLPAGLSIEPCSGIISGTPTEGGSFSVTVRAQDAIGSFQTKTLALSVVDITTDSVLPNATLGAPYSETLAIGPADTYFWQFTAGAPPEWLSIDSSTGQLTGTPNQLGDFTFTISVEGSAGNVCTKEFTLTVASIKAYWTFDEASGTRFDSSDGNADLQVSTVTPAVAGLIGGAIQIPTTLPATTWLDTVTRFDNLRFGSDGFTLTFWSRRPVFNPGIQRFWPFNARFFDGNGAHIGTWLCILQETFPFVLWSDTVVTRFYTFTANPGSAWRFFVFRYKPTGYCSLQMDLGGEEETPLGNFIVLPAPASGSFQIQSERGFAVTPSERIIDEMAFFGRQLSASELVSLYNSGAGSTWPNVPL